MISCLEEKVFLSLIVACYGRSIDKTKPDNKWRDGSDLAKKLVHINIWTEVIHFKQMLDRKISMTRIVRKLGEPPFPPPSLNTVFISYQNAG